MRRISIRNWIVPLALLGVVVLAYGVFIPFLGLYGDDWPYLWVNHTLGSTGYIHFVAWDRPFSAWIYLLATPVLGESVWAYHLFLLLLRWLCAVLLWWVIRLVWPRRAQAAAAAAFLLAIYPGFRQQPIPLEFMLHFSVLALFLFSLGAMLRAACDRKRLIPLTAAALVGEAGMFSLEYYFGLELLRPVLLWIVLAEQEPNPRRRAKRVFINWLPYLVVLAAFVAWRVLVFKFPSYQPTFLSTLAASPLSALLDLFQRILRDLKTVIFDAWRNTLALPSGGRLRLLYAALFAAGGVVAGLALWLVGRVSGEKDHPEKRSLALLGLGAFALLVAGWPFWVTGLPVEATFPWDRSTLAFMPGVCLLFAGILDLLGPRFRPLLLAGLVALGVGFQAQNALSYRTESTKLRDFFWQLSWRAPGLKPGTIVLSEQIPLYYYGDNGLTPPLNWTYAPRQSTEQQIYNFFDVDERLGSTLKALKEDLPIRRTYRSFWFKGSSSNILMVYARPGSCLRVLSTADRHLPGLPPKISSALALSHLDQIVTDAGQARPPVQVGPVPEQGWCYYFEKASLAGQQGDWQSAVALGDQARQQGLEPRDLSEWLPFVEGYARVGSVDQARSLSQAVYSQENLRPALCTVWQRAAKAAAGDAAIQEAAAAFQCLAKP